MGTIFDKLNYLTIAVNDIQAAINEKKVEVDSTIPLAKYGDKIREIETGGMWADYITLESFPSFTETDLVPQEFTDVSDVVKIGSLDGLKSRDYITMFSTTAFTETDLIAQEFTDASNTIVIIKNTYTVL